MVNSQISLAELINNIWQCWLADIQQKQINHPPVLADYFNSLPHFNLSSSLKVDLRKDIFIYKTPLCLQVVNYNQEKAVMLSNYLVDLFNKYPSNSGIVLQVSSNGWLEYHQCDRTIVQWLNHISKTFKTMDKAKKIRDKKEIEFIHYYTHARSCYLLTSAHNQNIITLNNTEFKQNQWYIDKPNFINYQIVLNSNSIEKTFIRELLIIADKIKHKKLNYCCDLYNLGKNLLTIEKYCSIWGETLIKNKHLSQVRLGLIALGLQYYQAIFYSQIEDHLPQEI